MSIDRLLKSGFVVLVFAFVMALYGRLHDTLVNVGDSAPNFTVTADGGRRVSAADFGGKALLLNFWASWCEPCQTELPSLMALSRALGSQGLVVLAISQDEDVSAYRKFAREMSSHILTVRQPDKKIQLAYGTTHIPESYLIDQRGRVRAKYISNQDWMSAEVVAKVRSIL